LRSLRILPLLLALCSSVALGSSACGPGASPDHEAHGVVVSLDATARKIALDHGDIPGFMKAMTMTFEVAPEVALDGVAPGVEVDFRAKEEGGVYTVTMIRVTGDRASGS